MYKGPERRQYKRIKRRFLARFRDRHSGSWDMVTLQNLGGGGALFNYDRKIGIDSILDMKINFPASRKPISCAGWTTRVEEPDDFPLYKVAVVFSDIKPEDKAIINRTAETFYAARAGEIEE